VVENLDGGRNDESPSAPEAKSEAALRLTYTNAPSDTLNARAHYFNAFERNSLSFFLTKIVTSGAILCIFFILYRASNNPYIMCVGFLTTVLQFVLSDRLVIETMRNGKVTVPEKTSLRTFDLEVRDGTLSVKSEHINFCALLGVVQCVHSPSDYVIIYVSNAEAFIIPRVAVQSGNVDELRNRLAETLRQSTSTDELWESGDIVATRTFRDSHKPDYRKLLPLLKRRLWVCLLAVLVALALIGGYVVWLTADTLH